jgi:hypothetical protein
MRRDRRSGVVALVPLVALAVVVAGCDLVAGLVPSPAPTPVATPREVTERVPLPPCGTESLRPNAPFNVEGRTCFWEAYLAGEPAEFISTQPTTEGDPITTYYRVLGPGAVEVFEDSTQDAWSSGGAWKRYACTTLQELTVQGTDAPVFSVHAGCRVEVLES